MILVKYVWGIMWLGLVACGVSQEVEPERPLPEKTLVETPVVPTLPVLSEAALEMQATILKITEQNSLRRFARLADENSGFASNFAGVPNQEHWSLLRRTGVDPLREIETLFAGRYATRTIGSEVWFIWPDFAAMPPENLLPEKLSFQDKARLTEMVGEEGIAQIRAGSAYPGFRTAISDSGRWVYYLHEIGDSQSSPLNE